MPKEEEELEVLRSRLRDLELVLGQGNDSLAVTFRLTPVLNNLMGLLLALPNVTPEMIRQRLEIAPDAKVAIHRLRKQIEPWGIKIKSRRNLGYWLEDDTKVTIRAMLASKLEQNTQAQPLTPVSDALEQEAPVGDRAPA
ncbi:hypothetical protein [Bradyrhizobium cenepequi]